MLQNKINQSSSRLLRMSDNDRPRSKDLRDLFSTLVVSLLPLGAHRVRFTKIDHTFLSEDAIRNLGNVKLLQTSHMPDPKKPSCTITTTSTISFSMNKDMACSVCQQFLDARFLESADGKRQEIFNPKGTVWKLTSKGITVLDWFCTKNGVKDDQLPELLQLITSPLISLERDPDTDRLYLNLGTIEVIFGRFVGKGTKGTMSPTRIASLNEKDIVGVRMTPEYKLNGRVHYDTFNGQDVLEWLMEYTTVIDVPEAFEVASLFMQHELIEMVGHNPYHAHQESKSNIFQPSPGVIYAVSQRGKDLVNGSRSSSSSFGRSGDSTPRTSKADSHHQASNTQRLEKILTDPALVLLFRENLRETHCEENLSFYQECDDFIRQCTSASRILKQTDDTSIEKANELLAQSYEIYNAFLAPDSPRELNINHQLRSSLTERMTNARAQETIGDQLQEVTSLFESAQNSVFKLVASDSVPKFLHNPKYEYQLAQAGVR
ncbi:regulator of G protein signaling domain-containing protein [Dactylonectria macrodidyma]|uniref:Regulator of G protein signaling domain-containing protein n=1 Tax=Dactylonectria macrodidyma TaxID=307937 RepID=A0A9P9FGC3_9HYPO|nr:regulator of G protein signaling domain-containing protein [Dactylonectria macrodidyma]